MMLAERATGTVSADQAIFTSIRSPMGEGYRIVAASKGVTADEKREILQYAPSHESLCDPSPSAKALACFPLSTGRRCIFMTRAAGMEHTGRGGYRVFTHILVLEPAGMRAFAWDPFAIAAGVPEYTDEQVKRPPSELASLSIGPGKSASNLSEDEEGSPTGGEVERTLYVVAEALNLGRMFVIGSPEPEKILRTTLGAVPVYVRQRISVCYGLKYSPKRKFDFLFSDATATDLAKIQRDCPVLTYKWAEPPPGIAAACQGWTRFVANRWEQQRGEDLREICAGLVSECEPIVLERIAALKLDSERISDADRAALRELERRHAGEVNAAGIYRQLLDAFRQAVRERRYELEAAEDAEEEIDGEPVIGWA